MITHPHSDHFSGANQLATDFVVQLAMAALRHPFGMGLPTYQCLIGRLFDGGVIDTFPSTMTPLQWRSFRMVVCGDAQMENWAFFDHERMMDDKCLVLRTAHHGSSSGTQWERLDRLSPSVAIVSSDPKAIVCPT